MNVLTVLFNFAKHFLCLFLCQEVKQESPNKAAGPIVTPAGGATATPIKKEANQWYDVGIIKGTSCTVSHYHLPSEASQGNGDVSSQRQGPSATNNSLSNTYIQSYFLKYHR